MAGRIKLSQNQNGHSVVLDTPDSNKGPSPMEMLLMGMEAVQA